MDEQLRLIDLIPMRLSTLALWLLAGLMAVAGLEALYAWMPDLAPMTTDGRVAALDLDGEGSLAVWFSSLTLMLAGVVAVLVYTIRRHKTDDYQGYYRVWLWAATCWLLMSIDETASLHEGFKEMMTAVAGTRLLGDGSLWWVIPYCFVLGAVGSRLLLDMWSCRLSTGALLTAAACYGLAVVTQLGWIMGESGARGVMVEEGAEMVGNLMLLLAMTLHARYVILDAEGLLPSRLPRAAAAGEWPHDDGDDFSPAQRWVEVDSPHAAIPPVHQPTAAESQPASSVRRKLTKAERKALRKRLLQQRLERERRQRESWNSS